MSRKIDFFVGGYYHIFNRGVDKRKIFLEPEDLRYFLDNLIIFNRHNRVHAHVDKGARKREKQNAKRHEPLAAIVAFAFLPNHFHLLLKEINEGGISKFMQKVGTSYTMFFNEKYDRSGSLFQGRFKATEVKDLIAVSSYVNLNFVHHGYKTKTDLVRTSFFEYVDPSSVKDFICDKNEVNKIVKAAGGSNKYKSYANEWSKVFVETHQRDKTFAL